MRHKNKFVKPSFSMMLFFGVGKYTYKMNMKSNESIHPWNIVKKQYTKNPDVLINIPKQQLTVLKLIGLSYNTGEIANIMKISEKTVHYHKEQLLKRFHIPVPASASIALLTRLAVKLGLVDVDYKRVD